MRPGRATARTTLVLFLLTALTATGVLTRAERPLDVTRPGSEVASATFVCPVAAGRETTVQAPPGASTRRVGAAAVVTVPGGGPVTQVTRFPGGPDIGLAALRCPALTTDAWFAGASTVQGSQADLVLVNADVLPAILDLTLWSTDGPVDARPGRGIVVQPGSRVVLPLSRFAPDSDLLAGHLRVSRGRVAPAVLLTRRDGARPQGFDWLPLSGPPASPVVVPGLPSAERRRALVTNTGADDVIVTPALLTPDGQVDLPPLDVPAGTTVARDLPPGQGALVLRGAPVLAAVEVVDEQGGAPRELAVAGVVPAVEAQADVPAGTLLLSAPADAVVLVDGRRLTVAGGSSVVLEQDAPGVLEPVAGQVWAGVSLGGRRRGVPLTAVLGLVSAPARRATPVVTSDPFAGAS